MSGQATTRNWADKFAPPPPPPLKTAQRPRETAAGDASPQQETDGSTAIPETAESVAESAAAAVETESGAGRDVSASAGTALDRVATAAPARHLRAAEDAPGTEPDSELTDGQGRRPGGRADESTNRGVSGPSGAAGSVPRRQEPAAATVGGLATAAEIAQADAILTALADIGVTGQLTGVRRVDGVRGFDIRLPGEGLRTAQERELQLLSALGAEALSMEETPDDGVIHFEVVPRSVDSRAKQVAVWLPAEVRDAVSREREKTDETFTEFFLGAFNRQYANLGTLFANRLPTAGPMPTNTPRRRRGIDTAVQAWIYLKDDQRAVLDETVEQYAAGSRSALITKILEADLGESSSPRGYR